MTRQFNQKELIKIFEDIYKRSNLNESAADRVASHINNIIENAISDRKIDKALEIYLQNEAKNRCELPIGNNDFIDLTNSEALRNYANDIINDITAEGEYLEKITRKIKIAINSIYKGNKEKPFENEIDEIPNN